MQITTRQQQIMLAILLAHDTLAKLVGGAQFQGLTIRTLQRDLSDLLKMGLLTRRGEGRSISYELGHEGRIGLYLAPDILETVFSDDLRSPIGYDFERLEALSHQNLFNGEESFVLDACNQVFKRKLDSAPADIIRRERERITIELSWKSSQMEGNTYTLLETESLLKDGVAGKGRSEFETQMVLNHKRALDFSAEHKDLFLSNLTPQTIVELHRILVEGLDISHKLRERRVSITGSVFLPLDNGFQIKEELAKLCDVINSKQSIYDKSLLALVYISYLQPFNDGNKRTGRILANALLYADGSFPLSLRALDTDTYKLAILAFYELGILGNAKQVYIGQARYAAENYDI